MFGNYLDYESLGRLEKNDRIASNLDKLIKHMEQTKTLAPSELLDAVLEKTSNSAG